MNVPRSASIAFVLGALLSCRRDDATSTTVEANVGLGGEVAAKVGDQAIPLSLVQSVASSQKISAREALRRVIDDEVAASGARSRGLDQRVPTAWRLVAARGKLAADRVMQEAWLGGPPTDEEVKALSARHWLEVDQPPAIHTIHALVAKPPDPKETDAAKALIAEIRKAVLGASTVEEFEAKAQAVEHPKSLVVRVEKLPAFVSDGRIIEGGGAMDEGFAKGAFSIAAIGETSAIVPSSFGWHVIRLIDRVPEKRVPFETRRAMFAEEALALRARNLLEAKLAPLRAAHPITISPAAEQLTVTAISTVIASTPGGGVGTPNGAQGP